MEMPTPNKNIAAFFDLDRTLIPFNSALKYAQFERREGRLSLPQLVRSAFWSFLYHLNVLDLEETYIKALKHYRGEHDTVLRERTNRWFNAEVSNRLQPGAVKALEDHRKQEHFIVLLTNSSCYVAEIATKTWKMDAWLANYFPLDDNGNLTGGINRPLCYGEGKVVRSQKLAMKHHINLENSYFYTDSYSDLPMLKIVGNPCIINPDPRLKRTAKKENWPILDWKTVVS